MSMSPAPPPSRFTKFGQDSRAVARFLFSASRCGVAEFQKDKAGQIAAALTYHTLFSLLPVIALALVILRTFVGPAEQLAFKDFVVDAAVDWLIARDGATGPAAGDQIIETPTTEFDATIALVDETIMELLDRLQNIDFQGYLKKVRFS